MTEAEEIKSLLNQLIRKVKNIEYDVEDIKSALANIQNQVQFIMSRVQNLD